MNLREQAESDLSVTLEDSDSGFGLPVELIDPDGAVYTGITGQVLYDSTGTTDAGLPIVVHKPVVTLRRSSLARVPLPTDSPKWMCRIPITPDRQGELVTYQVEEPLESGGTFGFIRLYLTRAEQCS
jgi:hypothetical protein